MRPWVQIFLLQIKNLQPVTLIQWRTYCGQGRARCQAAACLKPPPPCRSPLPALLPVPHGLPHSRAIRRVHSQPYGPVHLSCHGSPLGSGATVSAQAKLRLPHYRLHGADNKRMANAARETAYTIKRSREAPRAEASPKASGGGRTGCGEEGMTQSKATVASDACPPWGNCILSRGWGIGKLLEALSEHKFCLLRLQICSVQDIKLMHLDTPHLAGE